MSKNPQADIVKKALTDASFKSELLKNPNAAVEKALGIKLPSGLTIKVVEDSGSTVHLVLPAAAAAGQMSDKDLSGVAGGAGFPGFAPTQRGYCGGDNTNAFPCGF